MKELTWELPLSGIVIVGSSTIVLPRLRLKNNFKTMKEIEPIIDYMYDRKYFEEQKFRWIGLLFRFGLKNDFKPEYKRIDKEYGDLSIAIELNSHVLVWADKNSLELMKEIFLIATCEAVLDVLCKYKLPIESVENIRKQYGKVPDTIEECIEWAEKHKK